ncbi:glycolate oxidase subunit GlcE [Alcaligenaceae bacterium A4P071]|nr:glycolate oxidase subunit GlcE [Alcaligenaceae bacterium A4P071]
MDFVLSELCDQVMTARAGHKPLWVSGGGTKNFFGNYRAPRPEDGHCVLEMGTYAGIVDYHPSELVITVRAGTLVSTLEAALAAENQMLAFEPPIFGAGSTVGGCVAAGLAGPRRIAAGGVRDFVLGTRLLDAQGRLLSFGGEVMKNVAGYDVSRVLAGSMGILGAIAEVSLKVVPRPIEECTLWFDLTREQAMATFSTWRQRPLPISASAWIADRARLPASTGTSDSTLAAGTTGPTSAAGATDSAISAGLVGSTSWRGNTAVRLSGSPPALASAIAEMGGEREQGEHAAAVWTQLRHQQMPVFTAGQSIWRVIVPPTSPVCLDEAALIEWGGAQRWLMGARNAAALREAVRAAGGSATLYRVGDGATDIAGGAFHPPEPGVMAITRRLKQEFDPWGLFNAGRLYPDL